MQAVILAGGKGTRLAPYTTVFPKPLMPIGDYPILEVVIRQLKYHGFNNITLAVGHLKELIEAFFGDGKNWGVNIVYSYEDKPLGTVAPLKLIKNLQDDFLVMNGDVLTNVNYQEFMRQHRQNNAVCTISIFSKPVNIDLGVLTTDEHNNVQDYLEKPTLNYNVSMGVYAFSKQVMDYIPDNEYFDFPTLIHTLLRAKQKVQAVPFEGLWLDIGRPSDYEAATQIFEQNKDKFLVE